MQSRSCAEVLFVGVIQVDGKIRVQLEETDTHAIAWVEKGGNFRGYRLAEVNSALDVAVLEKAGTIYRLSLLKSKIDRLEFKDVDARESQFRRAIEEVMTRAILQKIDTSPDEIILLAAKFGRVVIRRESIQDQDVILLGLPGTEDGIGGSFLFKRTQPGEAGGRAVTVMIR